MNGDVQELYKMITDGFIDQPAGNISLELPNDIIELQYERNYGQPTVQFIQYINKNKKYVGKSQFLNKKQIDKIFGIGTPKAALYKAAVKQIPVNPVNNTAAQAQYNTNQTPASSKTPAKTTKKRK
jgi:hypothetical protein